MCECDVSSSGKKSPIEPSLHVEPTSQRSDSNSLVKVTREFMTTSRRRRVRGHLFGELFSCRVSLDYYSLEFSAVVFLRVLRFPLILSSNRWYSKI